MTLILHIARFLTSALYGTALWERRKRKNNGQAAGANKHRRSADFCQAKTEKEKTVRELERPAVPESYELEDDYYKEVVLRHAKNNVIGKG